MIRTLFCVENIANTSCFTYNNSVIKQYSGFATQYKKNGKAPKGKLLNSIRTYWKRNVEKTFDHIRTEWQRTAFFKEGGKHGEAHNIRPQQEYAISQKQLLLVMFLFILAVGLNKYPKDASDSNAYLKMLKKEQGESKDSNDK